MIRLFKTDQIPFLNAAIFLFFCEAAFFVTLLFPIPQLMSEIISILFAFLIPGCLLLLLIRKSSFDIAEFLIEGFVLSVILGTGISLIPGLLFREISRIVFISLIITISFLFLVFVWRRRNHPGLGSLSIDRYSIFVIVLATVFFSSLMALYALKSPAPASSDSARYFHSAQNYLRSFSFSPYPPFPLNLWEVRTADLGGAIDFRDLWIIIISIPMSVAEGASIAIVRTLDIFFSSMLLVATFTFGALLGGKKVGALAALFVALTPIVIFYSPYELPYIAAALFILVSFFIYVSAVGGEKKNFKLAYISLLALLPTTLFLHTTVFFFTFLLFVHFLFVVLKHGSRIVKVVSAFLFGAGGLIGFRFFAIYSGARFEQFLNLDLARSVQTIYYVFLIPLYLTAPIWVLFIAGALLTFINKKHKSTWGLNVRVTLFAIPLFLIVFVTFRYGVSFRFFLPLLPLICIISAYGFLETFKAYKRDLIFLCILYLALILYLSNTYPFTVIFPFGRVTLSEVYLTLLPAIAILVWKVLWKENFNKQLLLKNKTRFNLKNVLLSFFVILVCSSMISETVVYVSNPWLGVYVNPVENGLQEAGEWISKNVNRGSVLATNAWTHLGLYVDYTETPIVPFPSDAFSFLRWISERKMDYLIILPSLEAPEGITWLRSRYQYLQKYADPKTAPPVGTIEYYRSENLVVFKVTRNYESPIGVASYISNNSEVWTLENGYVQLNITRSAVLLSYKQYVDYTAVSLLDFEETTSSIDDAMDTLGSWNGLQWYNGSRNDWDEWNETSYPPQSMSYAQQTKVRLLWTKPKYNISMDIAMERGMPYSQTHWNLLSHSNNTAQVFPSIKILDELNRAYIPSNQTSDWSTRSTVAGNPVSSESIFGLGFLLSHTPGVLLSKDSSIGQQIPSGVILPEKTEIGKAPVFTFTFDVINDNLTDQWAVIEVYVPDELIDQDGDGFYHAGLQSYDSSSGKWLRDFARWDIMDTGTDAASIGPWADSRLATLLNGSSLSDAFSYPASEAPNRGIGLYRIGKRGESVQKADRAVGLYRVPGIDAPANITYSDHYGILSRLGFAIHLPGKTDMGSSQMRLRLYLAYTEAVSITYEFSNAIDTHYGLGSINYPFIWLYNIDEVVPSMGLVFNKKPSSLSISVDTEYNYKSVDIGFPILKNLSEGQQVQMNMASIAPKTSEIPRTFGNTTDSVAFPTALSSLAYYNFTVNQSNPFTLSFDKLRIENEFNIEPIYLVALNDKWTWDSGGTRPQRGIKLISNDQIFDVSAASAISFTVQPKAMGSVAIYDQSYDEAAKNLTIKLASGANVYELYGTLIVYMMRRIFVYCTDLSPTQVYVDSRLYDLWLYNPTSNLLMITVVEIPEAEVHVVFS